MDHSVNLLMVLPHVQQKNGAPLLHFLHIEAEMRDYLTFFHALAHQFGGPAPVHRLFCLGFHGQSLFSNSSGGTPLTDLKRNRPFAKFSLPYLGPTTDNLECRESAIQRNRGTGQIGRASCRERVESYVVVGSLKEYST